MPSQTERRATKGNPQQEAQIAAVYEFQNSRQQTQELQVLVGLYDTTGGPDWHRNNGWLSNGYSPCEWPGVVCNEENYVTALEFSDNHLVGTLPASILWDLKYLERVDLSLNPQLVVDFHSQVSLAWTPTVESEETTSDLPSVILISTADVSRQEQPQNRTTAPITYLDVSTTATSDLRGMDRIANTLAVLGISRSNIDRDAVPEIRRLSSLTTLQMNHVNLNAKAQEFFVEPTPVFSHLQEWSARNASLTGPIPTTSLQRLEALDWSGNQLSGTIPSNFLAGIENTTLPLSINLQGNHLRGGVPTNWTRFSSLHLDLTDNRMTSLNSSLCNQYEWMEGAVYDFGCDAILCPPGTYSEGLGRQDSKWTDCKVCETAVFYGSTSCDSSPIVIMSARENSAVVTQREVLMQFYTATGGPQWTESEGWLQVGNDDECQWFGVDCSDGGEVLSLTLPNNNLQGATPASLFRLPRLRRLVVTDNPNLEVEFVGLKQTRELEELLISNTATYSLMGIANATNLQDLEIERTQISGPNLGEVFSLTTLKTLNMGDNSMEQSLPEAIGQLSQLVTLRAANAGLYGALPNNLAALTDLVVLDLSGNALVDIEPMGEILNQLRQVRILDLHAQTLPFRGPLPALEGMVSLLHLDISSNALTGPIPPTFLSGIGDKWRSLDINLKNNMLTGTIPLEMALFQEVDLDVTENRIEGIPQLLCIKEDWMDGLVSDFGCDAILCPPGTFNEQGRRVSRDGPCEPCPNATLPHFGSVRCPLLEGESADVSTQDLAPGTSTVILSEREILELVFQSTDGPNSWVRTDNWLDNNTDICEWFGVTCDDDGQVQSLVLSENGLTQKTPQELFELSRLERLFLNDNPELNVDLTGMGLTRTRQRYLKGQARLLQASSLRSLVVSRTSTTSVAGISQASSLQVLNLNATRVSGDDLDELMTMTSLQSLNLGNTRINREIPDAIGGLVDLREFAASNSGITGTIPEGVGSLTGLAVLDLSANKLIGTLPAALGELSDIRILDLHDQSLSNGGGIGGSVLPFDTLPALAKIDLSENRLSGEIPLTFLSGILDKAAVLDVNLRSNSLRGGLPETLSLFSQLNIDVTSNLITDLPESLCSQESWMGGNAAEFGCDAILCPPTTYNSNGRQLSKQEPCEPCPIDPKPYYGASSCLDAPNAVDGDTMICADDSVCYNHGVCLESAVKPGTFVCDCTVTSAYGIPFAGFACEYKATDICHTSGLMETQNISSFCTNNGECIERVQPGAEHRGCYCDTDLFDGNYCEQRINSETASVPMKATVDITQICPDEHICENGSQCVASAQDPTKFECDCTDIDENQLPVAGENCQYPATSLCTLSPPFTSFCVNGGACVSLVEGGSEHSDCLCTGGYSGAHCEIPRYPGSESESQFISHSSGDDGMESWQMALIFVLPIVVILMILCMIVAAYSKARKKNLKYVDVDALADSEYEKYSKEDLESPRQADAFSDIESSDSVFHTPTSIVDRALALTPTEEATGFFSLPDLSKEVASEEEEAAVCEDGVERAIASRPEADIEAGDSPTTGSTSESTDADEHPAVAVAAAAAGAAAAAAIAAAAAAEESEETEDDEIDTEEEEDDVSRDELSTILEGSQTEASDTALHPMSPPKKERELERRESPPYISVPRSLPIDDESLTMQNSARTPNSDATENFRDAWEEKPRVAFADLPAAASEDSGDAIPDSYIGDIDEEDINGDVVNVSCATGKSLFAGDLRAESEDSVSFLDQSVGMSEDSERSISSLQNHTIEVSVEPGVAETMFGGRREPSETSSGELSLNF